jgi:HlyD family secretion protein
MRKKIKYLIIILVILAIPVLLWNSVSEDDSSASRYRTAQITRGDIAEVVSANGTLNPVKVVDVGAQVSGQAKKIYVKVNDEVKKDQLLAEIDPALPEAELKQRMADLETQRTALELSGRDLERTRELVKKDYVPKVDLERAEQTYQASKNSYESTKYQVEQAKLNLSYTKISSPIDGVIISQDIMEGQTIASNFQTPNLFKIAGDLTKMKIDVNFSEADISKVKSGMPVSFNVDAFPEDEFKGIVEIVNLNPTTQSGVVTYSVTVAVNNETKKLLPGMTAFVRVILSERKNVLRVPASALRFTPPQQQVSGLTRLLQFGMRRPPRQDQSSRGETNESIYLLKDGEPVGVKVTIGATDETYIEVSGEDVKEGDTVITGLMPKRK